MKYWKEGFHETEIKGSIKITDKYWMELLDSQSEGKQIVSDDSGYPIAIIPEITEEQAKGQEIDQLKDYLDSTDYIYPKCLELGLDVNAEYAEVVAERKLARERIQTLEAL